MRASFMSAAAALLLLAACGGTEDLSADQTDETIEHGAGHPLPLSTGEAKTRAGRVRYYGGPVLEQAKVVAVLWGQVDSQVGAHIGNFYKAMVGSAAFSWLKEYDTTVAAVDGSPGTGQHIGRGSFAGAVQISPRAHGKSLTDAQIEKELSAQIRAGVLPAADDNTLYMIHFAPGIRIRLGSSHSCTAGGFCGYHSAFRVRGKRIAYAVLPDMGAGSGCDVGCGGGQAFDRVTSVASHERAEATTDPEVGLASKLAAPLAWYDSSGGEIGDLCVGSTVHLRAGGATYLIQKEWSNAAGACR